MTDDQQTQGVEPGGVLSPQLCESAEQEFGTRGAWLLLSTVLYSWRAFFDLAWSTWTGSRPVEQTHMPPGTEFEQEFETFRHLQIQGFVYAAAEQFAALVCSARVHSTGSEDFFNEYVGSPSVGQRLRSLTNLKRPELEQLIGSEAEVRASIERASRQRAERRNAGSVDLDPAAMATSKVVGLHIPRSAIEKMAAEQMTDFSFDLVALILRNITEMQDLVEPPVSDDKDAPPAQPLREIDNSFRHGARVLLHSAVPSPQGFKVVGEVAPKMGSSATVFLPRGGEKKISYGGVDSSPESSYALLEALRELCTRTGQFACAFMGYKCLGNADLLAAATSLSLLLPDVEEE